MGMAPTQRPGRAPPPLSAMPSIGYYRDAHYEIGTTDPRLRADPGAGAWRSKSITAAAVAQRHAILTMLGVPTMIFPGINATKHLQHYFGNSGRNYTIDLEDMIASVPSARKRMAAEFRQAQAFLSTLPVGNHYFTSRMGEVGYNRQAENADWFFATGGYTSWGKGFAKISSVRTGKRFEVDFEYKVYDRYNWDGGKKVQIGGIEVTDAFMGEFHLQGLAQEFDCFGSVKRRLHWEGAIQPSTEAIVERQGR